MKSLFLILSNPRYFAPAFVFASLNIWFGTWAIYIPSVKDALGIDKSDLGIALFCLAMGVFIVFPFASKVINALGLGRATWWGVVLCSVSALLPLWVPSYPLLCIALFVFGIANGITDIAMNTLVTELEKQEKVQFMSAAHGFFSLGGVLAGLGSFLIPVINDPLLHMVVIVVVVLLVNLYFRRYYWDQRGGTGDKAPFSIKLLRPLFFLGLIGFVCFASEGAVVDWSALYLKEETLSPESLWGAGFLAFSLTMTLGRFLGDAISTRIGSFRLIGLGALVAILGYFAVLFGGTFPAILGFACIGLGFSVVVPELFRIGGKVEGVEAAQGVAFIAGTGYLGFLSGPVLLGFLAEEYNLKTSFWGLFIAACFIFAISIMLKRPKKRG